jgi:hypothetical protein
MRINIKSIPVKSMRYSSAGDYWIDKKGTLQVRVAECDERYEWLVLLHELVEMFICLQEKISFASIDKFDIQYEKDRDRGAHGDTDEPGDDPDAPYANPHCIATAVERMLCGYLGIQWKVYENCLNHLPYKEVKSKFIPDIPKIIHPVE